METVKHIISGFWIVLATFSVIGIILAIVNFIKNRKVDKGAK